MKKTNQTGARTERQTLQVLFLGWEKTPGDAFHILQIRAPSFDQAKV